MATVYALAPFYEKPGPARDLALQRGLEVRWLFAGNDAAASGDTEAVNRALLAAAPEIEYLITNITPLRSPFFEAAKQLKLVSMLGVGLDHIDIPAATEKGVLVTNAPGSNARSVAETAFALLLDLSHRVTEMHTSLAKGQWRPRMGGDAGGKVLGVVGLGHIGRETARLGKAFGMRVIAANRSPRPEVVRELGIEQLDLETVLREADFLSLHIPGGADSWFFGPEQFALMKKSAYIINTARGDILDLEALVLAVQEGRLAGAGLDVFPREPMDMAHPVFAQPGIVCTPHAAASSREALFTMAKASLDEVARAIQGEKSPNARNPEVYTMPRWKVGR